MTFDKTNISVIKQIVKVITIKIISIGKYKCLFILKTFCTVKANIYNLIDGLFYLNLEFEDNLNYLRGEKLNFIV